VAEYRSSKAFGIIPVVVENNPVPITFNAPDGEAVPMPNLLLVASQNN
jgi:hypothetical protein